MSLTILVRNTLALVVGAVVSFFYSYGFAYVSLAFSLFGFLLCFTAFVSMIFLGSDGDAIAHTALRAAVISILLTLAVVFVPPFMTTMGRTTYVHDTYFVYPGYRDLFVAWAVLSALLMITGVVGRWPGR